MELLTLVRIARMFGVTPTSLIDGLQAKGSIAPQVR